MASDTVATHLDANLTMTPDPVAIPLPTSPTMTPAIVTTPPDKASFASLPREIRDEIYRLALPHSWVIRLFINYRYWRSSEYWILSPQASNSTYANEAWAMLFQRNSFHIWVENLKLLLGEDGISCLFHALNKYVNLVPKGCFDVKSWLRDIVIDISMKNDMDELAASIGLLLECPALRSVKMVLHGVYSTLKRAIMVISSAFEKPAEKFGLQLVFSLVIKIEFGQFHWPKVLVGTLEKLEKVTRDADIIRILKETRNE